MSKSKPTMRWNIVRKAKNSLYYLESVEFESACSGASVFEQIRRLCLPQRNILSYRLSSLLYSPVVYTTTVIKGRNPTGSKDVEAQSPLYEVFLKNKRYSEAYTLALRDPTRFEIEKTPNLLVNRAQFDAGRECEQIVHGLLVVQEIRRAKMVVLYGVLALLSVGMGFIAGWLCGIINVGVGVAAGLFQLLTMLQWSYVWVTRS